MKAIYVSPNTKVVFISEGMNIMATSDVKIGYSYNGEEILVKKEDLFWYDDIEEEY